MFTRMLAAGLKCCLLGLGVVMHLVSLAAGRPARGILSALATTTAIGICGLAPSIARAQCDVNPTQMYAATTCTGTDPNTLVANTTGSTVTIQSGASVASVYATTVPTPGQGYQPTNTISIVNNGQIAGGLTVDSGTIPPGTYYGPGTSVNLTVGANASIGGSTAISLIARSNGSDTGTASLTLDNQGSIQSSSGAAITGNGSGNAQVASLINEAGGSIGAIKSVISYLSNSGTISGGAGSAIDTTASSGLRYGQMIWQNSGTITSNGAAATILAAAGSGTITLTNSGAITNSGSAIDVPMSTTNFAATIVNSAGGTISSSGGTAITANGDLTIINNGTISGNGYAIQAQNLLNLTSTGTINGSVEAVNVTGHSGGIINLSNGGSIDGSLTLGAWPSNYGYVGNRLIVDYADGAKLLSSITGTVTIGGTNNALILNLHGSTTLSAPLNLSGSFSTLGLQIASGSTVTLASGFSTPIGLTLGIASPYYGGPATLVNAANLTTIGATLIEADPFSQVAIVNSGTITANLAGSPAGTYAVTAQLANGGMAMTNSGTITGIGGNGAYAFGSAANTGKIIADGTALAVFDGTLTNSGTVSGGNTGLYLFGGSGTNTGTISGGQIGVSLVSTTLNNSGTITASGGLGVAIQAYSTVNNQQGGVINGGIGLSNSYGFSNVISNAGTINGDAALGRFAYGATNNTYIALAGGVLNGNLDLGSGGDRLVVSLGAAGLGTYSGITGSVTGSGTETLLSLVTANATATLGQPTAVFSVLGYDLANNASLTLTSTTPLTGVYTFAGTGTVNLTANISETGTSSLLGLTTPSIQIDASGAQVPTVLNFTSNGNLTMSAASSGAFPAAAVVVGAGSSFTNTGTISYNNAVPTPAYYYYNTPAAAISSSGTVTNTGTIKVGGGAAIFAGYSQTSVTVVNTGAILQIAGASDANAVVDVNSVTNSGTIAMGGTAVEFLPGYIDTLINSGTITSTDGAAIGTAPSSYAAATAQISNNAGGVIGGGSGQPAITLGSGSTVVNSGTINGDVQLGLQSYYYGTGSTYIANGGTLNGNLTFGGNGNTLVVIGAASGITGTINTGSGFGNLYAQGFTASTTVDLSALTIPSGFHNYGLGAIGSGTVLTINGPSAALNTALTVFGNGTVINTATVNGNFGLNVVSLAGGLNTLLGVTGDLTFINSGNLGDGVQGTAQAFTNRGTIGTAQFAAGASLTVAAQPTFTFGNSGQIWGSVSLDQATPSPWQLLVTIPNLVMIQNSGTISYGLDVALAANQLILTNSGSVNNIDVELYHSQGATSGGLVAATNTASGIVNYGVGIYAASHDIAFNNAGQISQYLNLVQNLSSPVDQVSAAVSNAGTISGQANLSFDSTAVSVTNTGTIASAHFNGFEIGGLTLADTTVGNSSVTFTNSGAISNAIAGQSAVLISVYAGNSNASATTAITVTNTGSIAANGGGLYEPFFLDQLVAAGLAVGAIAQGGSTSITITNAAGASISANGINNAGYSEYGIRVVPPALANGGSVALIASAQTINVTNAGTITGGGDIDLSASDGYMQVNGLARSAGFSALLGAIDLFANSASLTNTGTITGDTTLFAPIASFANYGTVHGNVMLGTGVGVGTVSVIEGINAILTGTVTGRAAVNTLTIDVTGGGMLSQSLLSQFVGFGAPHLTGSGAIAFSGALSLPTLVLDNASLTLAAGQVLPTTGPIALTGGGGTNSFTNYGTVNGAIVNIATTNGAGGVINIATTATSNAAFTNDASAQLNFTAGTFTIGGLVTNQGTITIADGATLDASGGIANDQSGVIRVHSGATVNDVLVNAGMVVDNGVYNADIVNLAGGTFTATGPVTSPNLIRNAGVFTMTGSTVSTPRFDNLAGGVLGGVLGGVVTFDTAGGTLLTNQGTIAGRVVFGAGANELLLGSGSQITGTVTGGSGSNLLAIMSSASDAAPDQFGLSGVTGFQQSQLLSGSVALSGSYATGSFAVLGGHLIGNAGSILNAATLTVASGATFGSAGTINGNITVNGTLASIGTMTVTGNVVLRPGSNTLLAGTGNQLPELEISGKLNIASGASLTFSTTVSQRQGTLVPLIRADGGIFGSFSAINLPPAYNLIDTGTVLEAYRRFVAGSDFGGGAAGALGVINTLVLSQRANAALIADLPLLDNAQGVADARKFAQLTPEPYATAMQIGIDNGLQIADTLRDFDDDALASPGSGRHAFTFVQAMGNWTHAGGNVVTGSSSATNATGGILGGVGWRGDNAAISLFAGGIHGEQTIAALGSQTIAHSSLIGVNALVWRNGFDASATLAYDNGIGDTTRGLPDGTTTWSRYGLRAMVADLALGYTIRDPSGWTMRPQIGLTHITTHRDAAEELGSTVFELNVAGARRMLNFVHASWRIAPPTTVATRFSPWASVGVRVRLNDDNSQATAFLPDATDPIMAAGVLRATTQVTFKAGFAYAMSAAVTLFGSFDGERGSGSHTNALNGGIRLAF